ncbi:MAG: nucleotidyltransferase [bacterium]
MPTYLQQLLAPKKRTPQGLRYLENVIRQYAPSVIQAKQVDEIHNAFSQVFYKSFNNNISEFIKSGSRAKGTAIKGGSDIDFVVVFKANAFNSIEKMYNTTEAFLKQYGPVRRQNVSFGLRVEQWEIDVTPAKKQTALSSTLSIRNNRTKSYIETNIKQHINFIRGSGCKKEIMAMKIWNKQQQLDLESFLIEVAVIQVLKNKWGYNLEKRLQIVLDFFAGELFKQQIVDPAKPSNILNADIDGMQKFKTIIATFAPRTSASWADFIK